MGNSSTAVGSDDPEGRNSSSRSMAVVNSLPDRKNMKVRIKKYSLMNIFFCVTTSIGIICAVYMYLTVCLINSSATADGIVSGGRYVYDIIAGLSFIFLLLACLHPLPTCLV